MRISDWSSDVCSSDLSRRRRRDWCGGGLGPAERAERVDVGRRAEEDAHADGDGEAAGEHGDLEAGAEGEHRIRRFGRRATGPGPPLPDRPTGRAAPAPPDHGSESAEHTSEPKSLMRN